MAKVYKQYSREEVEVQYDARGTIPLETFKANLQEYADASQQAREAYDCVLDVSFGSHPDETLDIFPAKAKGKKAPVFVFIHGGYWRLLSKDDSSNMAPLCVDAGAVYVAVNYSLAPGATLDEIVAQNRRALAWVYQNIEQYGGDPDNIVIGGSSAGGHLCGMMLADGWRQPMGLPENLIKGALLLSGLYDLDFIPFTSINGWLNLSDEAIERNSPIRHLPSQGCPLVVSYADSETDEFKRQSHDYLARWHEKGYPGELIEGVDLNHFDILIDAGRKGSVLADAVLRLLKLA